MLRWLVAVPLLATGVTVADPTSAYAGPSHSAFGTIRVSVTIRPTFTILPLTAVVPALAPVASIKSTVAIPNVPFQVRVEQAALPVARFASRDPENSTEEYDERGPTIITFVF